MKLTPDEILQELEDVYERAKDKGALNVALKALTLIGTEKGLFADKKDADQSQEIRIEKKALADMSTNSLKHLADNLGVEVED